MYKEFLEQAFRHVNAELVSLYFQVGKIVSFKVNEGGWGENIVNELADFIQHSEPSLKGFNRRGLYRMKKFYETYCAGSDCYNLWLKTKVHNIQSASHLISASNENSNEAQFVTTLLTQLQWSAHLHIFSKTKSPEKNYSTSQWATITKRLIKYHV